MMEIKKQRAAEFEGKVERELVIFNISNTHTKQQQN